MLLHIPQSIGAKLYKAKACGSECTLYLHCIRAIHCGSSQNRQKSTLAYMQQNLTACSGTFSILHLYYLLGHTKYFFCNRNSRVVWLLDCRLNLLWQCILGNIHAPFMLQVGNTPIPDISSSVLCGLIAKDLALNYFLIHTY